MALDERERAYRKCLCVQGNGGRDRFDSGWRHQNTRYDGLLFILHLILHEVCHSHLSVGFLDFLRHTMAPPKKVAGVSWKRARRMTPVRFD